MADMDLDELLEAPPVKATARQPARFAPKGAKFKPKPKNETDSVSILLPKKEKLDTDATGIVEMDIEVVNGRENVKKKKEEGEDFMELETETSREAEGEDEVVREIDVYCNPQVDPSTRLYVLQYPLRPFWRPYELDERCELVRIKPGTTDVEVDLTVDVDSKNYDSDADPRLQNRKQTLTSTWKPPNKSEYVLGVLTGNKMRPSMHHIDSKESKKKTVVPSNLGKTVKVEELSEGKLPGTSKKLGKPLVQNIDKGEGWFPLKYHGSRSDIATKYLQKMMAGEGPPIHFSINPCDYLNSICPGTANDNSRSKGPSKRLLLSLPVKERLKMWLLEGPPIHRFHVLKYLAPDEPVEEILGVLQEYARLVQGLWVPKSPLVYGTDQGIEVAARDHVLVLFSKDMFIKNSQIPQRPQFAKAMKDVLNILAVERPTFSDWKLKEVPDISFIRSHSSVVKKQQEEWECLEKKINDFVSGGRKGPGTKAASKSNTTNNLATTENSNKVATELPSRATSRSSLPEEAREAMTKALQKLFKTDKVCSFHLISQRLKFLAVNELRRGFARNEVAAANSIDNTYPDELQAILSQIAVNIHGVCVPKSSPDHPQYDPFRKVVIDLFVAEGPNGKIKKATIIEAAKQQLKREISQMEFQKVVQELCLSQGSAWVLKSGDGNPKH